LPSAPLIDEKEFTINSGVADGCPKMVFICHHSDKEIYVGANQADWTGLPAIGDIRRADRDHRLKSYIPLATRAYNALQQAEKEVVLPDSMSILKHKDKMYQIRIRAIAAMRVPPHCDFPWEENRVRTSVQQSHEGAAMLLCL
jgi:hypothetical protein